MAVEAAPGAMVLVNHEGKIALVNSHAEKLFGYERQELLGQSIEVLVPQPPRGSHADTRVPLTPGATTVTGFL